jgi:hypothetical protein
MESEGILGGFRVGDLKIEKSESEVFCTDSPQPWCETRHPNLKEKHKSQMSKNKVLWKTFG